MDCRRGESVSLIIVNLESVARRFTFELVFRDIPATHLRHLQTTSSSRNKPEVVRGLENRHTYVLSQRTPFSSLFCYRHPVSRFSSPFSLICRVVSHQEALPWRLCSDAVEDLSPKLKARIAVSANGKTKNGSVSGPEFDDYLPALISRTSFYYSSKYHN